MTNIQGVKSVEAATIRSFRIQLEPKWTNGHDFCELIINEKEHNFTARFYGTETYSYAWNAPGEDFIQFLINTFSTHSDYLMNKLEDNSISNFIDTKKSAVTLRKLALEARYNRTLDEEEAREFWEAVDTFEDGYDNLTESHFYDMYGSLFEVAIKKDVLSDEPWFEEFVERKEDWKCRVFCEKVAPILAEVLKQEYAKNP